MTIADIKSLTAVAPDFSSFANFSSLPTSDISLNTGSSSDFPSLSNLIFSRFSKFKFLNEDPIDDIAENVLYKASAFCFVISGIALR